MWSRPPVSSASEQVARDHHILGGVGDAGSPRRVATSPSFIDAAAREAQLLAVVATGMPNVCAYSSARPHQPGVRHRAAVIGDRRPRRRRTISPISASRSPFWPIEIAPTG